MNAPTSVRFLTFAKFFVKFCLRTRMIHASRYVRPPTLVGIEFFERTLIDRSATTTDPVEGRVW